MIPYYCLLGIPLCLSLCVPYIKIKKKQALVLDAFFVIWLWLLFFRDYSIGVDLVNYLKTFEYVQYSTYADALIQATSKNEYAFVIVLKVIADIFQSFRAALIVVALMSIVPIWMYYRKHITSNAYLAISILMIMGIFSMSFSGLRQIIAIGCSIPCMYFVKKKKIIPFLLIVGIAFLFHRSSIIMLVLYPVFHANFKWNRRLLLIVPALVLTFIFRVEIFNFLYIFIEEYYSYSITATNAYTILALFVIFLVFTYVIPDKKRLNPNLIGLRNVLILCTFLQIFASINPIAMRMNYYFIIYIPVLIAGIVEIPQTKYIQVAQMAKYVMIAFFVGYYFVNAYTGADYVNIYPYLFMNQV